MTGPQLAAPLATPSAVPQVSTPPSPVASSLPAGPLRALIPVIAEPAYRTARLKLQGALASLSVCETQRALAVAEFSLLYRSLPIGQQIALRLSLDQQHVDLSLKCEASTQLAEQLEAQMNHFELVRQPMAQSADITLLLSRRYRSEAAVELEQAEAWLQGSTAEELRLQASQTEAANAAKREFLSRMSHELRTPMNAIIGMTHLALRTDLDSRQRDYLEKISNAGQNLLGIINDILDFSKIEAGKLSLENTDFQLDKVLGDVANLVADKVFSKGLELLFSVDEQVPGWLIGDPLRLSQVLINLFSNAAKFTERGQITLRVSVLRGTPEQVELQFAVQDTGIGMTEAQMARLFQAFSQADVSTTRRYGGTGLGLSICQRLLEMMGGGISVSSKPAEGSCFLARARFGIAARPAAQVVPEALNQLRVLLVDDNPVAREVISALLAHLPLRCDSCADGEQALTLVDEAQERGDPYGLLLLDWQLGEGLDGLSVARQLRRRTAIRQPRIVLVTAYGREDVQQHGGSEVDACLGKPIRPSDLIDTLTALFAAEQPTGAAAATARPARSGRVDERSDWNLQHLSVLLVEDNPINRQIACELLEIVGIRVATAANGLEALAWLEAHSPAAADSLLQATGQTDRDRDAADDARLPCDLVLMDLNMPEMDGWECVARIRQQARWQRLPVLAMTAHAMQQERERCLALGMQDHIGKPIDPDHLYERLRHWSGRGVPRAAGGPAAPEPQRHRHAAGEAAAAGLPALPGFDTAGALRRLAGNRGLYRRLLLSLLHTQGDALARLEQALASQALGEAGQIVHTIKGVAANLGATALADAAACLETELKQGRCPPALKQQFADRLQLTLEPLRQAFEPADAGAAAGAATAASHGPLSRQQLQLLHSLDGYLTASDGEALELIESQRGALCGILGSRGYDELADRLQSFDFSSARQALQRLCPAAFQAQPARTDR